MMPLAMAKSGETVVIRKITGKDSIRQHLAELGLVVDESVTVVTQLLVFVFLNMIPHQQSYDACHSYQKYHKEYSK